MLLFALLCFFLRPLCECGGSQHDHKKMAEKKETLKEPVMEESSEVAIASKCSEEESAEDQDSEFDTETIRH